jgi:hypothetical protein
MKTLYRQGIQSNLDSYWMGQAATTPAVNPWLSLLQTGGQAFTSLQQAEAAEDLRKKAEAERAAAQATAATTAAAVVQKTILGLPATTFWIGAAGLGVLGIIAALALSKK